MSHFLDTLVQIVVGALTLDPDLWGIVERREVSMWAIATIVALAGVSELVGQSVILFANRVSRGRFVLSLALNGFILTLSFLIWSLTIWLSAGWLFDKRLALDVVVRIVLLGGAPYIFAFLIMTPYFGNGIALTLRVWSTLIILLAVRYVYQFTLLQALACAGIGWLLVEVVNRLLGGPLTTLRDWLWRRVTSTRYEQDIQDQVDDVIRQLEA